MEDQRPPEAFFRFFEAMPREGPGSDETTRELLQAVRPRLPREPVAADMGAGSGAATLVLAEEGGQVTAVDVWRPFLGQLEERARARECSERVATVEASMLESGLSPASLDLIWSEGSVFTVGFDKALARFAELLKPGGCLVVSECTWLVDAPPEPARAFWREGYPAMRSVAGNLEAALQAGWRFLEARTLANQVWEENFYGPKEGLVPRLEGGLDMQPVIEECLQEIEVFRSWGGVLRIRVLRARSPVSRSDRWGPATSPAWPGSSSRLS